jgi:hypothetical protein
MTFRSHVDTPVHVVEFCSTARYSDAPHGAAPR